LLTAKPPPLATESGGQKAVAVTPVAFSPPAPCQEFSVLLGTDERFSAHPEA
jgi:hypothetical protein